MQEIQKNNDCPHLLSRGGYELLEKKLLDEKMKKRQHDTLMTENPALIEDPPPPISHSKTCQVEDGPHESIWEDDI